MVLVVVSILSVMAYSRLTGSFAATRGYYDSVRAQVSYARNVAIAQRRAVFVRIGATQSRLCYSAAGACTGADAVAGPSGESPYSVAVPSGQAITAATFQFDGLGRYLTSAGATPAAALTITVSGDGALAFTVEPETGYVHS